MALDNSMASVGLSFPTCKMRKEGLIVSEQLLSLDVRGPSTNYVFRHAEPPVSASSKVSYCRDDGRTPDAP